MHIEAGSGRHTATHSHAWEILTPDGLHMPCTKHSPEFACRPGLRFFLKKEKVVDDEFIYVGRRYKAER